MRIIAGSLRGRLIQAPPGMRTRPMLDRVRQAVFNIIGAAYGDPGSVPAVAVLDIFAGSGALGIEALSRGAAFCCFVEEDFTAAKTLQGNLKSLGLQDRTKVVQASALKAALPMPPAGQPGSTLANSAGVAPDDKGQAEACTPNGPAPGRYTIVLLDPPYPMSRDSSIDSPIGQLLVHLPDRVPLDPAVLTVLRHEAGVRYDGQPYGRLKSFDVRRYGGMDVTFMELAGGQQSEALCPL